MRTVRSFSSSRIIAGTSIAIALLLSASIRADTVTLDNGKVLEGRVTDDGTTVTIELAQGVVKLSKSRVVAIEPKTTLPDEFAERSQKIRKQAEDGQLNA